MMHVDVIDEAIILIKGFNPNQMDPDIDLQSIINSGSTV